jgi:hypothetical protein
LGWGWGIPPALKKHTSFVQKFTLGAFVWLERQDMILRVFGSVSNKNNVPLNIFDETFLKN